MKPNICPHIEEMGERVPRSNTFSILGPVTLRLLRVRALAHPSLQKHSSITVLTLCRTERKERVFFVSA